MHQRLFIPRPGRIGSYGAPITPWSIPSRKKMRLGASTACFGADFVMDKEDRHDRRRIPLQHLSDRGVESTARDGTATEKAVRLAAGRLGGRGASPIRANRLVTPQWPAAGDGLPLRSPSAHPAALGLLARMSGLRFIADFALDNIGVFGGRAAS
jgi:hypothetical protein